MVFDKSDTRMRSEGEGTKLDHLHPVDLGSSPSGTPFSEERAELEWVLAQPEIARSANLIRFLSFICERYFAGATAEIREQSIATEALGRKRANFDSHADPIVRVTARTLRKKLDLIYSTDGSSRRLRIVLPVGHYVPEFVSVSHALAALPSESDEVIPSVDPADSGEPIEAEEAPASTHAPSWKKISWKKAWKPAVALLGIPAIFLAGFLFGRREDHTPHVVGEGPSWGAPAWADEFDGSAAQLPDPAKWTFDQEPVGALSGGDRQVYCSPRSGGPAGCDPHRPNAFLDGSGHLVLRAQKNASGVWTLVRISTHGLKDFHYGRIEVRMRMPVGTGLWPSFIMVGSNKDSVGWPASGSIDVAENVSSTASSNGLGPTMIRSTLHGPRYFGSNGLWHDFRLPAGARVDDSAFHTYGIIWSPGMVQFYVDDPANVYFVHEANDIPEGGAWVFDHPFYIQLSLGAGGDWAGPTDASTPNPADLVIDYVRAYKIPPVHAPSITFQPVTIKAGTAVASTVSLHSTDYTGRVRVSCSTDAPDVPCSLATPVLNFSDTLSQQDTLTLSTNSFEEKGRVVATPGRYHVTITATALSGDQSKLTFPFEVRSGD